VDDPVFGRRYVQVDVDLDTQTLVEIAGITGGRFYLATDAGALRAIYDEINEMEPTTFKVKRETVYAERASVFMLPALLVLLLDVLLGLTLFRRLP
jgi:Ca-activated chloride channel family protein